MFKTGINPHEGREIVLLAQGDKRIAYFPVALESEHFVFDGRERTLLYVDGAERAVRQYKRAYRMFADGKIAASTLHARCGILLGYQKDHIRDFLRRGERVR